MDKVVRASIQQLISLVKAYHQADEDVRMTNTPGAFNTALIHLRYLKKRVEKKAKVIDSMIHGKVLVVILETPECRVKRMLTNLSKEDFEKLCYDGTYQSYKVVSVTEIDTKTYEEKWV